MATGAEAEAGFAAGNETRGMGAAAGYGLLGAGVISAGAFAAVALRRRSTRRP